MPENADRIRCAPVVALAHVSFRPEILRPAVLDRGQHLAVRHLVAGQRIGHELPRRALRILE